MTGPANSILGPCPCQGCGTLVWWARGFSREKWNGRVVPSWLCWREAGGAMHKCDGTRLRWRNHRKLTRVVENGRRVWA